MVLKYWSCSGTRPYLPHSSIVRSHVSGASPPLLEFIQRVLAVTEPPRWHLDPALLAPREGVVVIVQDPHTIPPVLPVEVRPQDVPCAGGSQESREGTKAMLCIPRKAHFVQLGLVYCLVDR